ncbi:MAG: hypothetical protein E4H27_10140 [Anaerolineales bacterium]|nr:MAG: hypothetical protein E4H27_10140 [Anaerolineales bacterium]
MVKSDQRGQQLNGVMDVCWTMDVHYPIWSPISMGWYRAFMRGEVEDATRQNLVMQIVRLLSTIRDNLLYADGRNTREYGLNLVVCAQPLLNILINGLV